MIDSLIEPMKKFLRTDGIEFFRDIKKYYGRVDAVLTGDYFGADSRNPQYIHPVHFREGTQIRNEMRRLTNNEYDAHWYDDHWAELIEKCLGEQK